MSFDRKSSLKAKCTDFVNSFNIDFGNIPFVKIVERQGLNKITSPKLITLDCITTMTIYLTRQQLP